MGKAKQATATMQRYRDRMRAQGLRPVQLWVPDTRSAAFAQAFKRQALVIARRDQQPSAERDAIDAMLAAQDDTAWTS
jgi:Protein  of unknown function (DUF3018)